MSGVKKQAVDGNKRIFNKYRESLKVPSNAQEFIQTCDRVASWAASDRAYYPEARSELVNLMKAGHDALKNMLCEATSGKAFRVYDYPQNPLVQAYGRLATVVYDFRRYFLSSDPGNIREYVESLGDVLYASGKENSQRTKPPNAPQLAHVPGPGPSMSPIGSSRAVTNRPHIVIPVSTTAAVQQFMNTQSAPGFVETALTTSTSLQASVSSLSSSNRLKYVPPTPTTLSSSVPSGSPNVPSAFVASSAVTHTPSSQGPLWMKELSPPLTADKVEGMAQTPHPYPSASPTLRRPGIAIPAPLSSSVSQNALTARAPTPLVPSVAGSAMSVASSASPDKPEVSASGTMQSLTPRNNVSVTTNDVVNQSSITLPSAQTSNNPSVTASSSMAGTRPLPRRKKRRPVDVATLLAWDSQQTEDVKSSIAAPQSPAVDSPTGQTSTLSVKSGSVLKPTSTASATVSPSATVFPPASSPGAFQSSQSFAPPTPLSSVQESVASSTESPKMEQSLFAAYQPVQPLAEQTSQPPLQPAVPLSSVPLIHSPTQPPVQPSTKSVSPSSAQPAHLFPQTQHVESVSRASAQPPQQASFPATSPSASPGLSHFEQQVPTDQKTADPADFTSLAPSRPPLGTSKMSQAHKLTLKIPPVPRHEASTVSPLPARRSSSASSVAKRNAVNENCSVSAPSSSSTRKPEPKSSQTQRGDFHLNLPKKNNQLDFCAQLLEGLCGSEHFRIARYFYTPVDWKTLGISDYPMIVKTPMDMSLMADRLRIGYYSGATGFFDDFKLMIDNCLMYNPANDLAAQAGRSLWSLFLKEWKKLPRLEQPNTAAQVSQDATTSQPADQRSVLDTNDTKTFGVSDHSSSTFGLRIKIPSPSSKNMAHSVTSAEVGSFTPKGTSDGTPPTWNANQPIQLSGVKTSAQTASFVRSQVASTTSPVAMDIDTIPPSENFAQTGDPKHSMTTDTAMNDDFLATFARDKLLNNGITTPGSPQTMNAAANDSMDVDPPHILDNSQNHGLRIPTSPPRTSHLTIKGPVFNPETARTPYTPKSNSSASINRHLEIACDPSTPTVREASSDDHLWIIERFVYQTTREDYERAQMWNNRFQDNTLQIESALCLSLAAYPQRLSPKSESQPTAQADKALWPDNGRVCLRVRGGDKSVRISLSPPFLVTPENFVDVTPFIQKNETIFEVKQVSAGDSSPWKFILYKHEPTPEQLEKVWSQRRKDEMHRTWSAEVIQPFDIPAGREAFLASLKVQSNDP